MIVADNGSTDGSPALAERAGARVVPVPAKGYGAALMGGIAAARGRYVIMGDADDSYDFLEIPRFVEKLREGNDLVQGCRLPSGGGRVLPGAMPFLHRWLGNPLFSCDRLALLRLPGARRLLRPARVPEGVPGRHRPALHGDGVRDRDGAQVGARRRPHRRGAHHPAPRRAQGPRAAPEDVPRRLAHPAPAAALQPALALPHPRARARGPRASWPSPSPCPGCRSAPPASTPTPSSSGASA